MCQQKTRQEVDIQVRVHRSGLKKKKEKDKHSPWNLVQKGPAATRQSAGPHAQVPSVPSIPRAAVIVLQAPSSFFYCENEVTTP